MGTFIDRVGQVFGELRVLSCTQKASRRPERKTLWSCMCSCGNIKDYQASNLTTGNSTCCIGCRSEKQVTHGHARRGEETQTHNSWASMKARCSDKTNHNYGERGITFHPDWEDYNNFLRDMEERPEGTTLERLDVNMSYCKDNCVWANKSEQSYNRRKDKRNTSGVEGVSLRKDTGKWVCYIDKEGIRYRLGCHETKEKAISVRREKEIELYGKIKEN